MSRRPAHHPHNAPVLCDLSVNGMSVPGFHPLTAFYDLGSVASDLDSLTISASVRCAPGPDKSAIQDHPDTTEASGLLLGTERPSDTGAGLPVIRICEALLTASHPDRPAPPPVTPVHDQATFTVGAVVPFPAGRLHFYPIQVESADGRFSRTYTIRIHRTACTHRQAVFLLPGFLDSELATAGGRLLWPRLFFTRRSGFKLGCLPDGRPGRPVITLDPVLYPGHYGVHNKFRPLLRHLQRTLRDSHQVIFLPYDWRLDIRAAAAKLHCHVELGKFEQVSLVGYSLGGLAAAAYAAELAPAGRVGHLVSIGTPFLGLPKLAPLFMDGKVPLLPRLRLYFNHKLFRRLCRDILAAAQLLPNEAYFRWHAQYLSFDDGSRHDILSASESWQFLAEHFGARDWSSVCRDFHASLYRDGRHIVELLANGAGSSGSSGSSGSTGSSEVPSGAGSATRSGSSEAPAGAGQGGRASLIVGTGRPTVVRLHVKARGRRLKVVPVWAPDGDGTVPLISASLGETVPQQTFRFAGLSHRALLTSRRCQDLVADLVFGSPLPMQPDLSTDSLPAGPDNGD